MNNTFLKWGKVQSISFSIAIFVPLVEGDGSWFEKTRRAQDAKGRGFSNQLESLS